MNNDANLQGLFSHILFLRGVIKKAADAARMPRPVTIYIGYGCSSSASCGARIVAKREKTLHRP